MGRIHTENDPTTWKYNYQPASYFAPNSPPAATSACTKSIICMGVGLHLRNSARGGAAHAQ